MIALPGPLGAQRPGARRPGLFHAGPRVQQGGHGLFSFLGQLAKKVLPLAAKAGKKILSSDIVKSTMNAAKNSAIEAGIGLTSDLLQGKDMDHSLSSNLENVKGQIVDALQSSLAKKRKAADTIETNVKKKPKPKPKPKKQKTVTGSNIKGRRRDLFDD